MRPLVLAFSMLSLTSLRVCGSESDTAPPQLTAEANVVAAPPTTIPVMAAPPRRGGTVVIAGAHQVELLPKADGEIVAYVAGAAGNVPPPSQVNLTVTVQGVDAQPHPVVLAWDAAELRYEGRLVGIAPMPGPAQVTLVVAGTPAVAVVPMLVVVPATIVVDAELPRDRVEVNGPRTVEVDAREVETPEVDVRGPRARGDVRVVAPGVYIEPPGARIDVRIGLPPPPPPPSARIDINIGGRLDVREREREPHGRGHGRRH